jgi:two-component system sensor histidine kinase YesM
MSKHKLQSQLIFVAIVITVLIILIQVINFFNILRVEHTNQAANFEASVNQIEKVINDFFKNIEETAKGIAYSSSVQQFLSESIPIKIFHTADGITSILNYGIIYNPKIRELHLILPDMVRYSFSRYIQKNSFTDLQFMNKYNIFEEIPVKPYYTDYYYDSEKDEYYLGYVMPVRSIMFGIQLQEPKANFLVITSPDDIITSINKLSLINNLCIMLIDYNDQLVASNGMEYLSLDMLDYLNKTSSKIIRYKQERYFVENRTFDEYKLRLLLTAKDNSFKMSLIGPFKRNVLAGSITILVVIILCSWIYFNLTKPVAKLIQDLSNIKGLEILEDAPVLPNYKLSEVDEIGKYITDMLVRIQDMNKSLFKAQDTLYRTELAKKDAKKSFYQCQINPHFLYNTLEAIRSIAAYYNAEEIENIVVSMAWIFRYSVADEGVVSLADELECVQRYFSIIDVCYSKKISLEIKAPDEVRKLNVPKMILQPLVENAVYHGVSKREGHGIVRIVSKISTQELNVEVIDNGVGMNKRTLDNLNGAFANKALSESNSKNMGINIGLNNVCQRIKLICGEEFGMFIESNRDFGTKVIIKLPAHL